MIDWYTEIWGSDLLVSVPVYGYLQFKGVLLAMEENESLQDLGIRIPSAKVELIDNPTTHCAQKVQR